MRAGFLAALFVASGCSSGAPGASSNLPGLPGFPGTSAAPAGSAPAGPLGPAVSAPPVLALPSPVVVAGVGPPAWVQPGTRLTWYGAAASVAQSGYTYVEDPEGDWVDPVTNKHYRRTDESGEGMPTAAGEAYTQTDVLAVEGAIVVVSTALFSLDLLAHQYTWTPLGGGRMAAAAVDGAWVNPEVLRTIDPASLDGMMVLRGDYVLAGTSYHAISFVASGTGSYQSSTYDTASGVLLATNTRTDGAASPIRGPNDNNPAGNVQLSLTRLVGVRQRSLAGTSAAPPGWVAPNTRLAYRGTYTTVNPLDPGAGSWSYPLETDVTVRDVGATWATFASITTIDVNGSRQSSNTTGVTGSTGIYWYDPATLATFGGGQVLDRDPVTGATTTVEAVQPGGSGTVVTLVTACDGVTVRLGYELQGGALVALEIVQSVTGTTVRLQLRGGG